MNERSKKWVWLLAKTLLAVAILAGVGRQFYRDLAAPSDPNQPELGQLELRPAWLVLSGVLYLLTLSCSACFWIHLLSVFGQKPPFLKAYRAYFLGQLGKYIPGKAWALLLRGGLVVGPDVRMGTAIISAFYEVLTTMAAGSLIAAIGFMFPTPQAGRLPWHPVLTGLLLLGLCGLPLMPWVFNFLTTRMAQRFAHIESLALPSIGMRTLAEGLLITGCGWVLMGMSLWATLQGVLPDPPELTVGNAAYFCATMGLSYAAGFLVLIIPSGVGVREYFLLRLLPGPEKGIAAAVLILRLIWTSAELFWAGVLFFVKSRSRLPDGTFDAGGVEKMTSGEARMTKE